VAVQALHRSDVVLLGFLGGPADVGLYVPVLRIVEVSGFVLTVVGSYYIPVSTEFVAAGDWAQLQLAFSTLARWATVLASPLLAVLIVVPEPLLVLLFGNQLAGAGDIARILAVGYAVHVVAGNNGPTLIALGRTRAIGVRSAIALVVNIGLNLLLIPALGVLGAAVATTVVIIGLNIANSVLVWKRARIHVFQRPLVSVLVAISGATAIGAAMVGVFGWGASPTAVFAVAGLVGVSALGAALLTLSDEERALLAGLRSRLRRRAARGGRDVETK
jgi:O-antigen/teichoic acid export membrane protein